MAHAYIDSETHQTVGKAFPPFSKSLRLHLFLSNKLTISLGRLLRDIELVKKKRCLNVELENGVLPVLRSITCIPSNNDIIKPFICRVIHMPHSQLCRLPEIEFWTEWFKPHFVIIHYYWATTERQACLSSSDNSPECLCRAVWEFTTLWGMNGKSLCLRYKSAFQNCLASSLFETHCVSVGSENILGFHNELKLTSAHILSLANKAVSKGEYWLLTDRPPHKILIEFQRKRKITINFAKWQCSPSAVEVSCAAVLGYLSPINTTPVIIPEGTVYSATAVNCSLRTLRNIHRLNTHTNKILAHTHMHTHTHTNGQKYTSAHQ